MAPGAENNGGLLDLFIAEQVGRTGIFALILRFMRGTQTSHPAIRMARTRYVVVTALNGSLPSHADGETLCTQGSRLSLEILPAELQVLTQGRRPSK